MSDISVPTRCVAAALVVAKTAAAVALVSVVNTGGALAAMCSPGAEEKVFQTDSILPAPCAAGSTNNDSLGGNPLFYQVNVDALYGFSDWMFAGKVEFGKPFEDGTVDVDFAISGGDGDGTWSFVSDLFDLYEDAMIVLKGGSGNNTQETYVGYLLNNGLTPSGSYMSPFFNGNGDLKEISHISAYVRQELAPIPVPAAGILLAGALGGLAMLRRRRG